MEDYRLH